MKKRNMGAVAVSCLCLLFALSGCTQSIPPDEIVIGVVWPFAGENNLFNEGIDLAVAQINANGGLNGKTLKLLKEDDNSETVKGIAIAESLAENNSVLAVIGHRNSYVSIPASAIYEKAGVVMLSPASTASQLTQNGYRNIFRCIPGDRDIAQRIIKHLDSRGMKRLVLFFSNDAYGIDLANAFEDEAKLLGITIVDRFSYYSGLADLKRLQYRWQAFGYDGILIATSSAPEGARLIVDARHLGIQLPFAAGDALDSPELAASGGISSEGTVVGSVFDPDSNRQEVKRFVTAFQKAYQAVPTSDAALGYDAVGLLAAAIEQADTSDRASVADGLRNLGKWTGVCGVHELSATGDDLGGFVVLKHVQNGALVCLYE